MRNIILLFLILILIISPIYSQNYLINFAGVGASNSVDSIRIENLNKGTSLTIDGIDILNLKMLVTETRTINENSSRSLRIYPNPAYDNSNIVFFTNTNSNVYITILNQLGVKIIQRKESLEAGLHTYQISGLNLGTYIVQIMSEDYYYKGKIINTLKGNGNARVYYRGFTNLNNSENQLKSINSTVQMEYKSNDRLKFTGYSGNFKTIIIDTPNENKTVTFNFIDCTDGDNNHYSIVKIGSQSWMAENLKTTKNSDGTDIPNIKNAYQWESLSSPSYTWYNHDSATYCRYGALYNWYSVNTNKLCPLGWHVPSEQEWITLTDYLINNGYGFEGSGNDIAKSMAATYLWNIYSTAGSIGNTMNMNNSSGFSAIAGGYRTYGGVFYFFYSYGSWWSSSQIDYNSAKGIFMSYKNSIVQITTDDKNYGFSVRCLHD